MICRPAIATTILLLLLVIVPLTWAQERAIRPLETNNRHVLIIGNASYAHAGVLRNPADDAKAIGRTLEQLNFKVTTLADADERQMDQAIRNSGRRLRGSNGSLGQLLKRKKTLTTPEAENYFFIYFRDHLFLEKI